MGFSKKKTRAPVSRISDKLREENKIYRPLARKFKKDNPYCACYSVLGCGQYTEDVHHMNGRIGKLLNDTTKWLPVCREAHDWIRKNIPTARENGWVCAKGLWNKST